MMRRAVPLLLLALAPSCASQPPEVLPVPPLPPAAHHSSPADAKVVPRFCGPGSDSSAQVVDRGIGGTGIAPAGQRTADRGIGGTGIAPAGQRTADRGIGGTGIVGVITGFGSVCVNRLEVALNGALQVVVDGTPTAGTMLRAGEVVAIGADGTGAGLRARSIAVRHEVSGRVETGNDSLNVAGQRVAVLPSTLGHTDILPGEWVAISGLRTPDGTIAATRVDQRGPGQVTVHGVLAGGDNGTWRIGTLTLRLPPGQAASVGAQVVVSGHYVEDALLVEALSPDLLASDPPAYFGPAVHQVVIASYVRFENGRVRLNGGFEAPAAPRIGAALAQPGLAVVSLERENKMFRVINALSKSGQIAVPQAFPWVGPPPGFVPELPDDPVPGGASHEMQDQPTRDLISSSGIDVTEPRFFLSDAGGPQ